MADLNSLYPQPVAPGGGVNALLSDPTKAIGLLSGLQDYRIKQAQSDALSQIPAAQLQGLQIQNQTGQINQNELGTGIAAHYFGTLPDDATSDDVHRMRMAIRAVHPNIPASTINTVGDLVTGDPKSIKNGIATARSMAVDPGTLVSRVQGPPGPQNQPTSIPQTTAIRQGQISVAPPPGVAEAQTATGQGSGEALNAARQRSFNYRQEVFPLEQAIPALEKLGKTGTGPGTEETNHIKSFLQSAGVPGFDADKIKTFDEAKKYLTDFVNQNGNTGTNDKLAASFAGNPSVGISNAAATDVAKSALALRRMKQAQLVEFEKSGLPDSEYAKWAGHWQLNHDPRAFGFDMMTPAQRKNVLASFPEGKDGSVGPRDLFKLQVQQAHQAGIISPRGLGQ